LDRAGEPAIRNTAAARRLPKKGREKLNFAEVTKFITINQFFPKAAVVLFRGSWMNLPNAHDTLSSNKPEPSARKKNGPLRDHRATKITFEDIRGTVSAKRCSKRPEPKIR
jgi:hypothetical protein